MLAPLSLVAAVQLDRLSDKNGILLLRCSICPLCPCVRSWVTLIQSEGQRNLIATLFFHLQREGDVDIRLFSRIVPVTLNLTCQVQVGASRAHAKPTYGHYCCNQNDITAHTAGCGKHCPQWQRCNINSSARLRRSNWSLMLTRPGQHDGFLRCGDMLQIWCLKTHTYAQKRCCWWKIHFFEDAEISTFGEEVALYFSLGARAKSCGPTACKFHQSNGRRCLRCS